MRYWVNIYWVQLKMALALMMQYRIAVLIWAVWGFVGPLISLAVWNAATESQGGALRGGQGSQFTQGDFSAYFLVVMIISHLTMSWDAFEFAWRVRDGNLSPRLLKPLLPIHSDITFNIAFKLYTSMLLTPIWALLFWILKPNLVLNPITLLAALPALLMAGLLRYIWQYNLAMIAFWTTRVEAINQLYFTVDSFLSGFIAPLALLPGWLGVVAFYSPFRSMTSFPVNLVLGKTPPDQILSGFLFQAIWLLIGVLVFRKVWAAGVKQYSAVGA